MIPPQLTMSSFHLHLAIVIGFCTQMVLADCPRLCECKWKSGKESVSCPNANLSSVPLHLEAGTQVLDLSRNNLVTVKHDEFGKAGLLNLQKVYISQCRLKSLERYAFRKLINLVELDLSHNALTTVPSHTFDSIPELRELKLNNNPIQRIHNDAFVNVPQLIRLELSECRITTVEPRAFYGLEAALEWLKLDYNKLTEVLSSSFTILQNLHGLELAGNPWNCSCPLRPLREWMLRKNVPFGIPPVCQNPCDFQVRKWLFSHKKVASNIDPPGTNLL
jgi:Leucine-rich repeat (LRR) protein